MWLSSSLYPLLFVVPPKVSHNNSITPFFSSIVLPLALPQIISTGSPLSGLITTLPSLANTSSFKFGKYSVSTFHKSQVSETIDTINLAKKNNYNVDIFSGDLVEFKMWLQDQILLIGVDSMAGHLAAELGIPTLSIFGSQNPDLTRPLSNFSVIVNPNKECKHKKEHWRLCANCMDEIDEEDVYNSVVKLIKKVKKSKNIK